jgi:hypothetical protein
MKLLSEQIDCLGSFQPESSLQIENFFNYLIDLISIISNDFRNEYIKKLSPKKFQEIEKDFYKIKSIIKDGVVLVKFGKDANQNKSINYFKVKKLPQIAQKIDKEFKSILLKIVMTQIQFK